MDQKGWEKEEGCVSLFQIPKMKIWKIENFAETWQPWSMTLASVDTVVLNTWTKVHLKPLVLLNCMLDNRMLSALNCYACSISVIASQLHFVWSYCMSLMSSHPTKISGHEPLLRIQATDYNMDTSFIPITLPSSFHKLTLRLTWRLQRCVCAWAWPTGHHPHPVTLPSYKCLLFQLSHIWFRDTCNMCTNHLISW